MSNGYDKPPFIAPPPSFMQTGSQVNNQLGENMFDNPDFGAIEKNPFDLPFEQKSIDINEMNAGFELNVDSPPVNNQLSQEKERYKIIDMFWMLNLKIAKRTPEQLIQKEAHFVLLSYNINFGNLRVSFYDVTQNSIVGHVIFLGNMKRTVSGTIYPMSAVNIVLANRIDMLCIEQIYQDTGAEWQHQRPMCQVSKDESKIRLTIKDPKLGTYFYDFVGAQRYAFLAACQFTYTTGFGLMGQNILQTRS